MECFDPAIIPYQVSSDLYTVARWAEAACRRQEVAASPENMRAQLGEALYLVRFPLMSVEEFAAGPAQSGVLTDREVVQLFLYFTVSDGHSSVDRRHRWCTH